MAMNPREQKNLLRRHLQTLYGNTVDVETTIDEISSGNSISFPKDYDKIITNLRKYRGHKNFSNNHRQPEFDFLIPQKRIIIEYDERQHFSKARLLSLLNYPKDVKTFFDKNQWEKLCSSLNAKDNDPIDRDERRAFYDSVRDIEAYRNGWYLIRFYHREIDWASSEALKYLKSKIAGATKIKIVSTREKPRILRLALRKEYDRFNKDQSATKAFIHLANQIKKNESFDYLVTPGGFFNFKWATNSNQKNVSSLKNSAEKMISKFWKSLPQETRKTIKSKIKFITFGIDSANRDENDRVIQSIEMVALFDTSKAMIIHWTGKSYPTTSQQRQLITFDLPSHFKKVNDDTLCILGCHDLNIFSPRAKVLAGVDRQKKIKEFDKLMRKFKPNIILQHPHNTDTYKIWNTSWSTVEKKYRYVKHYASGIRYHNGGYRKRGTFNSVIEKTKKGQVSTISY